MLFRSPSRGVQELTSPRRSVQRRPARLLLDARAEAQSRRDGLSVRRGGDEGERVDLVGVDVYMGGTAVLVAARYRGHDLGEGIHALGRAYSPSLLGEGS